MIGETLGSYLIEAELGSGAMGVVYRGFNKTKNRTAAVKVISAEQVGKGKSLDRFKREIEILKQFNHPNIVRIVGGGVTGGKYYYAMEYIKGPTLDKVLGDRGPLSWLEVVSLGIQLCDALQFAHDHQVVHRDLKPSNLMVTEAGQLKLTDFGIAKQLDATQALTGTGRTLGTAAYMAPEQIRGTPEISHKTDLYALGAVFYQMLTGDTPFKGATALVLMHAHMNEPPKRPSARIEEIPRALDDLVVALMAKAPQDRPWDATAVGEILKDLKEKADRQEAIPMVWPEKGTLASMPTRAEPYDPTESRPAKSKKSKQKKRQKARLEVAGLAAALVLVAGLIGYLLSPRSEGYLFSHAETLMASSDPLDWVRAREEFLDPLDRGYPRHPYRQKTDAWRDKIELREVERRADVLEKPNLAAFSKPKTEAEALYRHTFEQADAALKIHHDRDAEGYWRAMEKQLTTEGREDRGWILLARSKAEAVAKAIELRRKTVASLLAKAAIPDQLAGNDAARRYTRETLSDLVNRFDPYTDVADLVDQAKAWLLSDRNETSAPRPEPPAEGEKPTSPEKSPVPASPSKP